MGDIQIADKENVLDNKVDVLWIQQYIDNIW
jgi:hypothetical protein